MSAHLVNVAGTSLLANDTRERYRQKLARITLDSMVQFVGLLDSNGTLLEINQVAPFGDEYSGTGIGLAICQRIIDQYQGRIWVESEVEQGSVFYFELPR